MYRTFCLMLILLSVIFFFSPLYPVFSFKETRTNTPQLFYINVTKEKNFEIKYTHSIHLSNVLENYEITDTNDLQLLSMEYEDVSIGMPSNAEEGQTITYEDGKYKLEYKDRKLNSFVLLIGNIDTSLEFLYNEHQYDLKDNLERGKSYEFEVCRISLFDKLKGVNLAYEDENRWKK